MARHWFPVLFAYKTTKKKDFSCAKTVWLKNNIPFSVLLENESLALESIVLGDGL